MTRGEYQRYRRIVLRFFPLYLDYQLYRRPKEMQDTKGFKAIQGGKDMNREDVVQAALTVERWCREHYDNNVCDCPFSDGKPCWFFIGDMPEFPCRWGLEEFLRTRGLKHD